MKKVGVIYTKNPDGTYHVETSHPEALGHGNVDDISLQDIEKKFGKKLADSIKASEGEVLDAFNGRVRALDIDEDSILNAGTDVAKKLRASSFTQSNPSTSRKILGSAIKGLGVLDKGLAHAGKLAIGADIAQGNIPEAAISAAQFAAPKLGAAATRAAPFLELLRPESTQTQEQEDAELEQAKFNKLKQALKKRGLAVE